MALKIGINGFGRIGRCVARAVFENNLNNKIEIVMINAPSDIASYAHLLKYDSVHGAFQGSVATDGDNFVINGNKIKKTSEQNIEAINWDGVDIVFECSGQFNTRSKLEVHLQKDVQKLLVSAPLEDPDVTVIYGVNQNILSKEHKIISIGSCTTNCLVPIANILNKEVGIEKGFVTTIHAYTNDQRILDGNHKDLRRARACNLSMIPTTSGVAKAIGQVLPELKGKLDGSAVRVPVPNVSMIDLSFAAKENCSVEKVNEIVKQATVNDKFGILEYLTAPLVSIDMNHSRYSAIFDPFETKVVSDNFVRIVSWYDNEWAYSLRMLDVAMMIKREKL